ncbi:ribosomal-protein-alanine N-acetyltransferase [Rhizobium leguminosarum]|uniref:Ribosomal-protein-alanine N-acetyltransferase n=1 Tax=Rhizobium leguminosarum TaxID=384 RepID=A0AAE2MJR3_RHILE|nr:ribosomal-protein-alanine N-acetyltransferase [Rhizobium leguminosarum]MBB4431752.1 ribosomal-protein-alanine N-acetyltransferase [Rhizobium esperanzae]MBB4297293.1 ribosomal-protein-alanine N-acetyltransferase [Rhizobium leguminosarum]MBB4307506.1 ribosomal-protein-alanine N-acetyltransferase [Rhizobium leguminosarum]MBB4415281.1 ribosomal-protein-alanine N-acetyltransferase [Rhizobium leguminosarum]
MVTDLTIRKIAAADHQAVGAVGFAAWAASDAFEDSYRDPDVIARVRHEFAIFPKETIGEIFVAERGEMIIGWGARENEPNYVSDLWVHPDHQGKGVGRALLLHLCELMAAEGLATARLDTHAGNDGAIRLYQRCGFTIVWRGREFSKSMGVELEKVHLEKRLADR